MTYHLQSQWRSRAWVGGAVLATLATVAVSLTAAAPASADKVTTAAVVQSQHGRGGGPGWGGGGWWSTTTTSSTSTSTSTTASTTSSGQPSYGPGRGWRWARVCTVIRHRYHLRGRWFWRVTTWRCRWARVRAHSQGYVAATTTTTVPPTTSSSTTSTSTTTTTVPPSTNCSSAATGTALDRTGWVATSNTTPSSSDAPGNALDGNLSTRFSTGTGQAVGQYLQVDLGEPQSFNQLEMLVPGSPTDFARGYNVDVSNNGSSWTTVATCTGTGTTEVASFPTQTAQYVAVVLTAADSTYWWSVDELYLLGTETALNRASWVAGTNTTPSSADAPGNALDGNLSTRFSTDAPQAVGQYFDVDMGAAQTFNQLQMDVPNSPNDYARGYNVEVSNDGSTWTTVASGTGTGPTETVVFPTQTAQYVMVVLTAVDSTYWWSIDEFNLYTTS